MQLNSTSLRVKKEFKLNVHCNGNQTIDANDDEGVMDEDDIDEDEERYAALMAAAEDTDEDDEGITI